MAKQQKENWERIQKEAMGLLAGILPLDMGGKPVKTKLANDIAERIQDEWEKAQVEVLIEFGQELREKRLLGDWLKSAINKKAKELKNG